MWRRWTRGSDESGAVFQHDVVELALVEAFAELLPRPGKQLLDLQHADFVGAGLPWHDDVTLDLGGDFAFGHAGFLEHVSDGLLPRPALRRDAGIDDQSDGAEDLRLQSAKVAERVAFIPAGFLRQPLGVERPAFGVGSCRRRRRWWSSAAGRRGSRSTFGIRDKHQSAAQRQCKL